MTAWSDFQADVIVTREHGEPHRPEPVRSVVYEAGCAFCDEALQLHCSPWTIVQFGLGGEPARRAHQDAQRDLALAMFVHCVDAHPAECFGEPQRPERRERAQAVEDVWLFDKVIGQVAGR